MTSESLVVGGTEVAPGERARLDIRVARTVTGAWLSLPVTVVRGRRPGPALCLSAAVHGDELNGLETIRRVLERLEPHRLAGAVVAAPIVNVFGFAQGSRYLPDRRDLNRSFPGSERGSLAARLAHLFMREVLAPCRVGIDLHTGSHHRTNLPQVRADLGDPETLRLALAFGAPVAIHAGTRDGSLRAAATARGVAMLLYEAGEASRFDETAISTAVRGSENVMRALEMLPPPNGDAPPAPPVLRANRTRWLRAGQSGIFRRGVELGERVEAGSSVGEVGGPFGEGSRAVRARRAGLVIGHALNPLVNRGDALVHLASVTTGDDAEPESGGDAGSELGDPP